MKQGVHRDLNSNAVNTSNIDPVNKACWACHGDGTEPSGILQDKSPKNAKATIAIHYRSQHLTRNGIFAFHECKQKQQP